MYCRTVLLFALTFAAAPAGAGDALPAGAGPAPLDFPHFPDRLHAFVFRNWNTVSSAKLAQVLDTSADNVRSLASAMGLPAEDPLPPENEEGGHRCSVSTPQEFGARSVARLLRL